MTETMRCPTCRAAQVWADSCRRCKCDLRLLREAAAECDALRNRCLSDLRDNRLYAALELARQVCALRDDDRSRRLQAVCELLNGHWESARERAIPMVAEQSQIVIDS